MDTLVWKCEASCVFFRDQKELLVMVSQPVSMAPLYALGESRGILYLRTTLLVSTWQLLFI